MTVEASVAHAIHLDMDIIEACPEVRDMDMKHLEPYIDCFVQKLQHDFSKAIYESEDIDPAAVREHVPYLPKDTVAKMCRTVAEFRALDALWKGELPTGEAVYEVRMTVRV